MTISPLNNVFQFEDLSESVFSYLNPKELALKSLVSKIFNQIVNTESCWRSQCNIQKMPGIQGVEYRQLIKEWYPRIWGEDFYFKMIPSLKSIGEVPTIPKSFTPRDGFRLILIPKYLVVDLKVDSFAERSAEFLGLKTSKEKLLRLPVTINNIAFLSQMCRPDFSNCRFENRVINRLVLNQHGNNPVEESYWSYQKEEAIGFGLSYSDQLQLARQEGLFVTPLLERLLFQFFSYLFEDFQRQFVRRWARTSTLTLYDNISYPSAFRINNFGNGWDVMLNSTGPDKDIGIAAGLPRGS